MKALLYVMAVALFSTNALVAQTDINATKGIAINGYDVVSYFNGAPEKGSDVFKAEYDGVTFLFASEENLDKFEGAPKDFLPQYGGYCAYAIAVNSKKVSVNPETYQVKDDKLFLFYNKGNTNTLQLWKQENPKKLKEKADANWEKIVSN
jgi:YHS domain-containing protein